MSADVKRRRQKRMRQLFAGKAGPGAAHRPDPSERGAEYVRREHTFASQGRQSHVSSSSAYAPIWGAEPPPDAAEPAKRRKWRVKLAVAILLYTGFAVLFAVDHPTANRFEGHVRLWMTQSYDFAAAQSWYTSTIGRIPSIVPAFGEHGAADEPEYAAPVQGVIARSYDGTGVWLSTVQREVRAITEGWVVHAGFLPESGLTVIMRHANGLESVYGHLAEITVEKNDWLQGEAQLGTVKDETDNSAVQLFVAVKRQGLYINPGEVIPFD